MSTHPPEEGSKGRFINASQALPAVEVDCSTWEADIPNERWSTGQLVSGGQHLPAVEIDCATWEAAQAEWLELVVSFEEQTPPIRVMEHANRMMKIIHDAAPELGLTYDFSRSRTEGGDVVIALTPTVVDGHNRLRAIIELLQQSLTRHAGPNRTVVRLAKVA